MERKEVESAFTLARIPFTKLWELKDKYGNRPDCSWWLVKTPRGLIEIGRRKRVINVDWEDTDIRCVVTDDDVTKTDSMVHAWNKPDLVKYLSKLGMLFNDGS